MADTDTNTSLHPTGPFLSVASGDLEARLYRDSGHLELAGPDLAGAPQAVTITLAPPAAVIGGQLHRLGQVISSTPITHGVECAHALAAGTARIRLAFVQPAVVRFEVVDWGNETPTSTSLVGASPGNERFYGFGEKFNTLDQTGRTAHMLTFDHPGAKGDHSYKPAVVCQHSGLRSSSRLDRGKQFRDVRHDARSFHH